MFHVYYSVMTRRHILFGDPYMSESINHNVKPELQANVSILFYSCLPIDCDLTLPLLAICVIVTPAYTQTYYKHVIRLKGNVTLPRSYCLRGHTDTARSYCLRGHTDTAHVILTLSRSYCLRGHTTQVILASTRSH